MTTGDSELDRSPRDPGRFRWSVGGAVALLVLTALIALPLLMSGGGWSAGVVDVHANGTATLTIRGFEDAAGFERRLAEAGIPSHVTFAPEGMRCAAGTGPSDVADAVLPVEYATDGIVVHIGPIDGGSRLALTAFLQVGGDVVVKAAIVPLDRERCLLERI